MRQSRTLGPARSSWRSLVSSQMHVAPGKGSFPLVWFGLVFAWLASQLIMASGWALPAASLQCPSPRVDVINGACWSLVKMRASKASFWIRAPPHRRGAAVPRLIRRPQFQELTRQVFAASNGAGITLNDPAFPHFCGLRSRVGGI